MLAVYCIIDKDSFVSPLHSQQVSVYRCDFCLDSVGVFISLTSQTLSLHLTLCTVDLLHAVIVFCVVCPLLSQYK